MSTRLSCGRDLHHCSNINGALDEANQMGIDFVCVPLVNPRYKREFIKGAGKDRNAPLTRSDLLLTGQDWSNLIVAKISPWIQLDSRNSVIRKNSELAFKQELNYASHLGVPAIVIPVKSADCSNLARILSSHVISGHNHQYWIKVPLKAAQDDIDDVIEKGQGDTESDEDKPWKHDTWTWWNKVKTLCDYHKKVSVALELTADLPSEKCLERWCGEPVKSCFIPTHLFLTNRKGYPVLTRAHQNLLKSLFKLDVQMIIKGNCKHSDKGFKPYTQYLEHIFQSQEPPDNVARFARGYEDYLQCPLQPLMDNLESGTYEVFEKDPVKYSQYQKAIYKALLDRVPESEKDSNEQIVMVVGAGRGPLVTASLTAAQKAERKIRVYAVEKNPNAVVTLRNLQYEVWGDQVTIVSSDMRCWDAPEKADILVSELLGSFGDNELSPECLDGAQKFLKDDGISIPCDYTSFVAPICSSKLWNETRNSRDISKSPESPYETPYVVRLHNVNVLSKAKPLFVFHHPNRDEVIDNSRYDSLEFDMKSDVVVHGFAGYFDCVLFDDVHISIEPASHSPGMFSWFPIYFPIKEPVHVKEGDQLTVEFWRLVSEKNVWYEWCISSPIVQPLHNPKGRSYTIGL